MTPAGGTDWADRTARRWVTCYTRALDADTADRRRAELESDLYEHRGSTGSGPAQQWDVLGRVLWGIPADLSWRRAALASTRRRDTGAPAMTLRTTTTLVLVLLALFELWAGIGVIGGGGVAYATPLLVGAVLITVGLVKRDTAPGWATACFIVAALIPAVTLFWMAVIFLPMAAVVITLVVASSRPRPSPAT